MENEYYKLYSKLLEKNEPIKKRVESYLVYKYKLDSSLKGFLYLVDIISLSLILKKYSRTTINELSYYIAYKYNIKHFSVQRQLRYTCTIRNKYLPIIICEQAWWDLHNEIEYGMLEIRSI